MAARAPSRSCSRSTPDVITVVDEAYLAYGDAKSCIDLALPHPHCVVLQTLSKIGLAGLRVGYLVGRREVVAEVEKVRPPYNLNTLSQRAAIAILTATRERARAHFAEVKRRASAPARRARAARWSRGLSVGGELLSGACAGGDRDSIESLAERGVVVRCFDRPGPLAGCLRVTVGTEDENEWLLDALRAILKS